MASFTAFLDVAGKSYPLFRYEMSMHQETDTLGRPASPVLGGTIVCVLSSPGAADPFLYQWAMSPTMQQDGRIRLLQPNARATEKTISFFNAYCTGLDLTFQPGQDGGAGSSLIQITISPQRIAIGPILHDNNWPVASHGAGESFAKQAAEQAPAPPAKQEEPSAFMEGLHGVLDVVGMIPIIGEVADAANAAIYLSEGRYGEAAMAAASMIPLAGNVVGAAKLGRRALKVADKLSGVTALASKATKKAGNALEAVKGPLDKLRKKCGDPVDVASGDVIVESVDFELSGPIPLRWRRLYLSSATRQGAVGHGWSHAYEWAIIAIADDGTVGIRDGEGRLVAFEAPEPGGPGMQSERLALFLTQDGAYRLWHMDELLWYTFGVATADQQAPQPLQAIENPNGFAIRFSYTEAGSLQTITDSAGRVFRVETDAGGQLTAIHSPQTAELPSFALVRYAYDEAGNLTVAYDAEDYPMRYYYQGHQLVRRTARNGVNWYFEYESSQPAARCVHTWGDGGLLDYTLYYDSETQTTVLDSYQQPTVYTHQDGLVTRQVDALGGEQLWTYSDSGQLLAYRDPLGNVTRYEYDEQDRLLGTTTPDGNTIVNQYDERGLLAQVTDTRGERWNWSYNERGNLLERTDPLGHSTRYAYDEQGHLSSVTDAAGQTSYLRYDEQHNIAHLVTPDEQIRSRHYDGLGRPVALIDSTGTVQRRTYDRLGQLLTVEEADGTIRQLTYDPSGNVIEARQNGQVIEFSYTGLSQIATRRQAGQAVQFEYDREGRLTGLLNETGLRYRFGLDPLGQVIEEEGFDGILRRYERDEAGRVLKVVRAGERQTEYSYGPGEQPVQIRYSDGTQEVYDYDEAGALIKAQNNAVTVRLERDALGRVIREEQGDHWVEYAYNELGERTAIRSSLGATVELTHDVRGHVSAIRAGSWQADFQYDGRGLEVQRTLSGGVQVRWQRDTLGRPTQQLIGDSRQRQYQWQGSEQLTRLDDSLYGESRFEYDPVGALTKAWYADGHEELRLADAAGNLFETATRDDRQYGPGGRLLSGQHGSYTYDADGNLTDKVTPQGETWQYTWADNGTLTQVTRPDGAIVAFTYDALNRRISKTFKGRTTRWVWQGDVPLHEWSELHLDGRNTDDVITWLFEEDSFAPVGKLQGVNRHSILTDHLGTPLEMVDQGGRRTWAAQTTAYGRIRLEEGTRAECPFRFQGQYEDVETGLYYNRFRYYDPQAGTYVSQDPIRILGGSQLYAYVKNVNNRIDPFGLMDARDIQFSQTSISDVFTDGPWKNRTLIEAIEETKKLKKLPPGLTLNVFELNGGRDIVTLNNRTLYVAQQAGIQVSPKYSQDINKLNKLLDGGLPLELGEQPIIKCKK